MTPFFRHRGREGSRPDKQAHAVIKMEGGFPGPSSLLTGDEGKICEVPERFPGIATHDIVREWVKLKHAKSTPARRQPMQPGPFPCTYPKALTYDDVRGPLEGFGDMMVELIRAKSLVEERESDMRLAAVTAKLM